MCSTACFSRVHWGPYARSYARKAKNQGVTPVELPAVRLYLDTIKTGYVGRYRMRLRHRKRQWISFRQALKPHATFARVDIVVQRHKRHYAKLLQKYPPQNSVRLEMDFSPTSRRAPGPVEVELRVYDSHNHLVARIREHSVPNRKAAAQLLPTLARRFAQRPEALRAAARGETAMARALFDGDALPPMIFAQSPDVPPALRAPGPEAEPQPPLRYKDILELSEAPIVPPSQVLDFRDVPRRKHAFRLIRERPAQSYPVWKTLLKALGGLEVAGTLGIAQVSSSIRDENGASIKVASGRAEQRGFRIALHAAPDTAGFFVAPAMGYLFQDISIRDFQFQLPQIADTPGTDIAATCSRPTTGAGVSCDLATEYALRMQSAYGGVSGGVDLVAGNSRVEYFAQAVVSLYALEWRSLRSRIGSTTRRDKGVTGFRSGAAGLTTGFRFPKAHLALKVTADYEVFSRFEYGEPIEFRGPVELDEAAQIYRRRRVFAESAKLGVFHGQLAMAILF